MHQPNPDLIHEHLEDYLSGRLSGARLASFEAAVAADPAARELVSVMRQHSGLLQSLRLEEELDPRPGFYGRVIGCIDEQRISSFWSFFLEPSFGKRLATAALMLLIVLGGFAIGSDPAETLAATTMTEQAFAAHEVQYPPTPGDDVAHDRDVVLVHLATWGGGDQPKLQLISE